MIELDEKTKTVIFKRFYKSQIEQLYNLLRDTPEDERLQALVSNQGIEALGGEEDYAKYYDIKEGDVIVDAGAHVGIFTKKYAKLVGDEGRVLAAEPDFRALGLLTHNLYDYRNVTILPVSLWNEEDVIPLHFVSPTVGIGVSSNTASYPYWHPTRAVRLDDLLKHLNIDSVDFIKMDIEGSEIRALQGAEETLKKVKAVAIAAYHHVDNKGTQAFGFVEKILKEAGFPNVKVEIGHDGEIVYANRSL